MRSHRPLAGAMCAVMVGLGSSAWAADAPSRPAAPARGGAVAVDREALVAYVADADNAAIHRVDLLSFDVTTTRLECAPEQVAILGGDRVAVSLRGCNRVAVLAIDAAGAGEVVASAEVAPEPFGLAVSPRGEVIVVSAWGHAITALDGETLAQRFSLDLAREPRGVAVSSDGRRAFVTHAVGDAISVVDLEASGERPAAARIRGLGGVYRNRVDHEVGAGTVHPSASLAYAAVINERGTRILVPHLAVQNGAETVRTVPGAYGGVPIEEDTSVPSVAVFSVQSTEILGAPPASAEKAARQASIRINQDVVASTSVAPAGARTRQARAAAILGDSLFVTSTGTGELVELDARSIDPAMAPVRSFAVGQGPTGVDVDARTAIAVVWNQFSHDLSVVSLGSGAVETIPVASDPLPADVAAGRRLFHAETDHRISRDGRACAGCHPDGREDGLVWKLGAGPRQTPMLVGRLETGPYGWLGKHPTLEGNMSETISRLGGAGLPEADLHNLAAFLRRGLRAPKRAAPAGAAADQIARGKELFSSDQVGCSGCHVTDREESDRQPHDIGSRAKADTFTAFRTPPLLFISGTAPYFHDGRYPTLEALLDDNLDRMGSTTQLSASDRGALLAYLRTL